MASDVKDAGLKTTVTLPNGAATTYSTTGIDTGKANATIGVQPGNVEWLLTVPALNTTQLPDTKTMKYSILTDTVNPIDGSSTVEFADVVTQTGAGGAGAAATTYRFRLKSTAARIVGVKAVGSASGDASGATATLEAVS